MFDISIELSTRKSLDAQHQGFFYAEEKSTDSL